MSETTRSYVFSSVTSDSTMFTVTDGPSAGSVTFLNTCARVAPSILAASISECGTACSPDR
ncbi:hypothetical protein B0I32_102681 [Nonomuraea fuscirosea]|uniref:Uncharacterized protein n=1 Tax=Nonomuraea fuscirosea TaxID=1291556 RepID=A0A2T0NA37_9ACTN|nr:hypothetical protein [Nonomuraea fuscirosea]PRX69623.1 hypothetical protein B0I32_102681 [Nonomuraea fuscirosea]